MASHRKEIIWIHAVHGFLRGPEDFRPLAASLEAAFIQPPSHIDSLNWSLGRDIDLDDSVRIRLVSWDLRSWLSDPQCASMDGVAQRFYESLVSVIAQPKTRSSSRASLDRHLLLGEGLGARVLMRAVSREWESQQGVKGKRARGRPGLPLDRVVFLAGHPGIRDPQERVKRQILENQWAERILREPLETIRKDWFKQLPFSTSPQLLESLQSEAEAWAVLLSRERLAKWVRVGLLGRQDDQREALQQWRDFGESARFLWIAGEKDRKFVTLLHELQDLNVPGEFWMCPQAGHAVFLDAPDDLADRIRLFLI